MTKPWIAAALLAAALLAVVTASAWLSDDAYILLRTIDNALNGYGLRWNVAERVQTYTCPLWTLLLTLAIGATGAFYATTVAVSLAVTALAIAGLLRLAATPQGAALALLALLLSKAFVDYSTSGLENPLTHALLVAFVALLRRGDLAPVRQAAGLGLVAALLAVNRLDAALLVAPALARWLWLRRDRRVLTAAVAGLAPLLLWHGFSLVYYGFAFPNTAYAKLHTGVPRGELVIQGFVYVLDSLRFDPLSLPLVAALAVAALVTRQAAAAALMAGPLLHTAYVVAVGGDFMSGRFFSGAVVLAAATLATWPWPATGAPQRLPLLAALAMVLLGMSAPFPAPLVSRSYRRADEWGVVAPSGIADERGLYHRYTGLWRDSRPQGPLNHPWAVAGRRLAGRPAVVVEDAVGFFGFSAGPAVHIVDRFALGDALLARQPCQRPWRIGHFARALPAGYLESLRSGRNLLVDPATARRFDQLQRITRGPLGDPARWRAIAAVHLE